MKTKRVASMMPLLASIGFGIAALASPFLLANHYIMVDNKSYNVDNYLFFFWAKYYTVTGVNMIQSQTSMYDFGDFPIYAMAAIIIGLVLGAVSAFGGRGIMLNIKGRELKIKLDTNPVYLQIFGLIFLIMSYIYLGRGSTLLGLDLQFNNYVIENGPAVEFLFGSIIALSISTIMTAAKYLKEEKLPKKNNKVSAV
jgi:hypothetical protein